MYSEKLQKELLKAAPHTTLNWQLYRKRKQKKLAILGIIILIVGGIWWYFHSQKVKAQAALVHTVVANETIPKGALITEDFLKMKTYEAHALPDGFKTDIMNIKGTHAVQEIPANSILTDSHVKRLVTNDSLALELDPDTVALTINEDWLESKFPKISKGDRVSVLVSNPKRDIEDTVFVVKHADVIDVAGNIKGISGNYITLKVTEEQSRNLLYARAHDLIFVTVLSQ